MSTEQLQLSDDPTSFHQARSLIDQGHFIEALALLASVSDGVQEPLNSVRHYWIAKCYFKLGHLEMAREHCLYSCRQAPFPKDHVIFLAEIFYATGDIGFAAGMLMAQYQQDPDDKDISAMLIAFQAAQIAKQQVEFNQSNDILINRFHSLFKATLGSRKITVDTLEHSFIGGLAIDTAQFPKILDAGLLPKDHIFLSGPPANDQLLRMLERKIPVARDPAIKPMDFVGFDWQKSEYFIKQKEFKEAFFGKRHAQAFDDIFEFCHSTNGRTYIPTARYEAVNNSNAMVSFTPEEELRGQSRLREMGIPADAWFVCIFARDGTYYKEAKDAANSFRNSDIEHLRSSVAEINNRGGYVLRMGSAVGKPFEVTDPRYVDYATKFRDDFMDIYLIAKCRFFMGTHSGLSHVAFTFRKPLLNTNTVNMVGGTATIFVPKKIRSASTGKYLSFKEAVPRFYGMPKHEDTKEDGAEQRRRFDFEYEENSSEELREATVEMLDRVEGTYVETEEHRELQRQYRALWAPIGKEPGWKTPVSVAFLARNREILFGQ